MLLSLLWGCPQGQQPQRHCPQCQEEGNNSLVTCGWQAEVPGAGGEAAAARARHGHGAGTARARRPSQGQGQGGPVCHCGHPRSRNVPVPCAQPLRVTLWKPHPAWGEANVPVPLPSRGASANGCTPRGAAGVEAGTQHELISAEPPFYSLCNALCAPPRGYPNSFFPAALLQWL